MVLVVGSWFLHGTGVLKLLNNEKAVRGSQLPKSPRNHDKIDDKDSAVTKNLTKLRISEFHKIIFMYFITYFKTLEVTIILTLPYASVFRGSYVKAKREHIAVIYVFSII